MAVDARGTAKSSLRGRYWLAGSTAPNWVPVVDLPQISDDQWRAMTRRQPWWLRLWLRWSK